MTGRLEKTIVLSMSGKIFIAVLLLFGGSLLVSADQEEPAVPYLQVEAKTNKKSYFQGEEGQIKLRITPRGDINVSVYPEMLIRFKPNANLVFAKNFFTASELDFLTFQEKDTEYVYYNLDKEIVIPFKVGPNALLGRMRIEGEVAFSAIFLSNHWCLKTYETFEVEIVSRLGRRSL